MNHMGLSVIYDLKARVTHNLIRSKGPVGRRLTEVTSDTLWDPRPREMAPVFVLRIHPLRDPCDLFDTAKPAST